MPTGPRFARLSYTLFTVAVLAALIKLGAVSGANPFVLRMVPATPVAKAIEVVGEEPGGRQLDLPDPERERYTLGGRLLPSLAGRLEKKEEEKEDAPVFFRPSSKEARDPDGEPVCGDLGDFPKSSRAVFPLEKSYFDSYEDTWGAARPQGGHEGTDLMSPAGTPEFAITDGTIVPVSGSNKNGWNTLGGYTMMLEAAYDIGPIRKGDLFYYAHLDEKSTLPIGTKVRAGQQVGIAGDTGEGREVTRGKFPPHLHLGWYDTDSAAERTNLESGAMNPYPLLLWLEENGGAVAGGTDASYCEAPQEPESSTDGKPASDSPGTRPDLDTGSADDARPSPVIEESRHDHPPAQQSKPNSKKSANKANTPSKDPVKHPDKSEKNKQEGRDETSAPDGSAESKEQPSHPSTGDGSPGEIQENNRPSASGPRLHSGWASRSSYASALVSVLDKSTEQENRDEDGEKLEEKRKKPTKAPDDEVPKASEPDRSRPAESSEDGTESAPEPAKPNEPRASCDPESKSDKEPGVYIVRTQERSETQLAPIERDAWLALVRDDPEMLICRTAVKTGVDRTLRNEEEGPALWTGHPSGDEVWFDLRNGKIVVRNPDEPTIEKMRDIAEALGARVQGEDGK